MAKKFSVVINVLEEASIDYTVEVEARDEQSAIKKVENAIKQDGTAFMQYDAIDEMIVDTFGIEGEEENVICATEISQEGDDSENHF